MTITVYVGDTSSFLQEQAQLHHASASHISVDNFQDLKPNRSYYTSIGDLDNLSDFAEVLRQADTIVYVPPSKWSDENNSTSAMQRWTEMYLSIFCCDPTKTVIGFVALDLNKTKMLALSDARKTQDCQIWIAGCSISHGIGVANQEKYGELISKELNLPVSFLTRPGGSNRWASDQILRSDIRSNDILFWGITSSHRLSYWNELTERTECAVLGYFDKHHFLKSLISEKYLASDQMIYESLVSIYSVINFCNKNNVTLILTTLMSGMEIYLQDLANFTPLAGIHGQGASDRFLDLGTDNRHPGPLSHQFFKRELLKVYYRTKLEKQ